ncbi:hypothetical protein [Spiroplasma endosymbiont of Labia minor]|uniref:hypothetical protein n=1 Tax=Spiroplasma endosymbiont of Labia minor TaxID=3066305 RepID=UPI0030D24516
MFLENNEWEGMYIWCIKCWNYRKHNFVKPINIYEINKAELICEKCNHHQQLDEKNFEQIKLYYRNLNKENH